MLAIVDALCVIALFSWAVTKVLPVSTCCRTCRASILAWFLRHETVAAVTLVVLVVGAIALGVWIRANVAEFRQRVRQAFTVVRTPARWLRTVVAWQLAEWALRLATIWFMLGAFRIEQSARNVLLVAAESLATIVPISPGGIGTQQALLVYTLRGSAVASGTRGLQRRHETDPHLCQRHRGLHGDPAHAADTAFRRASDPAAAADTS